MRAIRMHGTGSTQVLHLDDVEVPEPGFGEVQIRVVVAGMNFTDVMRRQGVYMSRSVAPTGPSIPGTEVAGVVSRVGPGIDESLVGRRVAAFVHGGYAEYAVSRSRWTYLLPDSVSMYDGAACLVQGSTAWLLLKACARLQHGESVLVHSAAGGVGTLALQLARELGAGRVLATASTGAKLDLATSLGADAAIDYTRAGWAEEVLAATGGDGVDVVLDAVGGLIGEDGLTCLADEGRIVVYGVSSKEMAPFAGSQLMQRNQSVTGFWLTSWMDRHHELPVHHLLSLVAAGRLTPVVRTVFPLEEVTQAQQALAERSTVGKILLTVG